MQVTPVGTGLWTKPWVIRAWTEVSSRSIDSYPQIAALSNTAQRLRHYVWESLNSRFHFIQDYIASLMILDYSSGFIHSDIRMCFGYFLVWFQSFFFKDLTSFCDSKNHRVHSSTSANSRPQALCCHWELITSIATGKLWRCSNLELCSLYGLSTVVIPPLQNTTLFKTPFVYSFSYQIWRKEGYHYVAQAEQKAITSQTHATLLANKWLALPISLILWQNLEA